jgi:hypothetical protein
MLEAETSQVASVPAQTKISLADNRRGTLVEQFKSINLLSR